MEKLELLFKKLGLRKGVATIIPKDGTVAQEVGTRDRVYVCQYVARPSIVNTHSEFM